MPRPTVAGALCHLLFLAAARAPIAKPYPLAENGRQRGCAAVMDMMQACWNWMMGLGWMGMLIGLAVLVLLAVLLVVLIQRAFRKE